MRVRRVKDAPTIGVSRPEGPIDFRNVDALRAAVDDGLRRGVKTFVLDLAEVRYVNSLGISALISIADRLAALGGTLLLAAATPKLKVVFDLMGLGTVLPLKPSVASAVCAASAAGARKSLSKGRA